MSRTTNVTGSGRTGAVLQRAEQSVALHRGEGLAAAIVQDLVTELLPPAGPDDDCIEFRHRGRLATVRHEPERQEWEVRMHSTEAAAPAMVIYRAEMADAVRVGRDWVVGTERS